MAIRIIKKSVLRKEKYDRTPDHILDKELEQSNQLYDFFTSKIEYKFLGWDSTIHKNLSYSEAMSMETESLMVPSYTEFFRIPEGEFKEMGFGCGYFWGREIHPNTDRLAFGFNTTFKYKCLLFIPEKVANLRLIKVEK